MSPWSLFKYSWQLLSVFFSWNKWFFNAHTEEFSIFHSVFRISLTNLKVRKFLYSIWKSTKLRKVLLNKPFFVITLQDFFKRKQLVKSSLNIDSETICILCSKRTWKVCLLLSIFKALAFSLSSSIDTARLHYNKHIWLLKSQCISYHYCWTALCNSILWFCQLSWLFFLFVSCFVLLFLCLHLII